MSPFREESHRMKLSLILLPFVFLLGTEVAAAADLRVTEGRIAVVMDSAAPELTCRVVRTSGDFLADDAVCARAAAANALHPGVFPIRSYFTRNQEGVVAGCRARAKIEDAAAFERACAELVQTMGRSRPLSPIRPEMWLRMAEESGHFVGDPGALSVRLGVGRNGTPTYCLLLTRSGNRRFDGIICRILLHRARFRPALNSDGEPTPGTYIFHSRLAPWYENEG
jgi:hypothetical protein